MRGINTEQFGQVEDGETLRRMPDDADDFLGEPGVPTGVVALFCEVIMAQQIDQGASLLERLEQRAAPSSGSPTTGLTYNFPLAWYRRPDGDIVQLQSDPYNRTMYEDLGFVFLRPPEAREWVHEVRPGVIAEQKRRAGLITAIRRIAQRVPQYVLDEDQDNPFSERTTAELEEIFEDAKAQTGLKMRLPPIKPEPKAAVDTNLAGVETSMSMEELDSKLTRGRGYDPMREAGRR